MSGSVRCLAATQVSLAVELPATQQHRRLVAKLIYGFAVSLPVAPSIILPSHQIDARYSIPGAHGWTSCCLDLQLRSWLTERGLWSGRGFVAILNSPDLSHSRVRAVVAHELGHWLVYASDPSGRDEVELLTDPVDIQTVQACGQPHACVDNRAERDAWLLRNPQPPWHGHGLHFQRALSHVFSRGRRAFRFIEPEEVDLAGEYYALSPAPEYLRAFGDELADFRGSIAELLNTPVPKAACELFLHDVDLWLRHEQQHADSAKHEYCVLAG